MLVGHNSTARTIHSHREECRAGGTVAAPPTATVNVGPMTAGSHRPVPRAPQSWEIPARRRTRSAQAPADWGGAVQEERPRPTILWSAR